MTSQLIADQYLRRVIARYTPTAIERLRILKIYDNLGRLVRQWANVYLAEIRPSGSFAKGTAIRGNTDLDIFVSLKQNTPGTLGDLYDHLDRFLRGTGLGTEMRNVSIRVSHGGFMVDIVPGRRQHPIGYVHSLFSKTSGTWLQTNVHQHVQLIKNSPRRDAMRLTKIWRQLRGLDFPSFYLELSVIEALKAKLPFPVSQNMLTVLAYLSNDFGDRRILDPANTNNIVSDELSALEKRKIVAAAKASLQAPFWSQIVW